MSKKSHKPFYQGDQIGIFRPDRFARYMRRIGASYLESDSTERKSRDTLVERDDFWKTKEGICIHYSFKRGEEKEITVTLAKGTANQRKSLQDKIIDADLMTPYS